jgi:hypothetical protein
MRGALVSAVSLRPRCPNILLQVDRIERCRDSSRPAPLPPGEHCATGYNYPLMGEPAQKRGVALQRCKNGNLSGQHPRRTTCRITGSAAV